MSLKNSLKSKKAQSILEYTILFAVTLVALIASGFFTKVNAGFLSHFNQAVGYIIGG